MPFIQSAVLELAAVADPTVVHAAIALARQELDEHAVTVLLCALAAAGRLPESASFVPALALVAGMDQFLGLLCMSPDDPTIALLDLLAAGTLSSQRECMALFVVAERHRRDRSGQVVDSRICRRVRQQMRKLGSPAEALVLALVVDRLGDSGVSEVAKEIGLPRPSPVFEQRILRALDTDWRQFVPERKPPRVQVGTVRRQAPKVQRNAPCPCGSGRKYKKCCADSGDVSEAVAVEQTLTVMDYWAMRPAEIARLDLARLDHAEMVACFRVALRYHQWELAERFMAALHDCLQDHEEADAFREELCQFASAAGATEVVDRNVACAHAPQDLAARIGLEVGLLRPDAGTVAQLEAMAAAGLKGETDSLYELAYGLLDHSPALGILVARGALDPQRSFDSWQLLDDIERARDVLLLPPGDPAARTYEKIVTEYHDEKVRRTEGALVDRMAKSLSEKQQALEARQRQATALQQRIDEATQRIALLEKQMSAESEVASVAPAVREPDAELRSELVRLRGRVTELKGLVNENRDRREALERQLESRLSEGDRAGVSDFGRSGEPKSDASDGYVDVDVDVDVSNEVLAPRTVSVPVFDEVAKNAFRRLDRATSSRIVRAIGLVAAADLGAWREVKALRAAPGHLRLRVGQYRVLFREDLEQRALIVEQIVVRCELEAAIRRLE